MVGVTGLEPMASWSRTKRDTKLRHTPMCKCESYYTRHSKKNQVFFEVFCNFFAFCCRVPCHHFVFSSSKTSPPISVSGYPFRNENRQPSFLRKF